MNLEKRIYTWLAVALVLVYWGLAFPFSLLYLNYDPSQGQWIWIDYLIFLPLFAGVCIFYPIGLWLRPIRVFLKEPKPSSEFARQIRPLAENLPLRAVSPAVAASLAGYLCGSAQLRYGAQLPVEEVAKNALLSIPTGLLAALLIYFILAAAMRPVVELSERIGGPTLAESKLPSQRPRVRLLWKTWACFLVVGLVPVTVLGLTSYTSNQRQLESSLAALNMGRLENFANKIRSGRHWRLADLFQGHEIVAVATPPGRLTVVRGPEDGGQLQNDLPQVKGPSGSLVVRQNDTRILVWNAITPDRVLIVLVPLADYAPELLGALQGTLLASGITLLVSLGLASILASHLAYPVTLLTRLSQGIQRDRWRGQLAVCYTDDELGQLARSLRAMLGRLHATQDELTRANSLLAELVEDRTIKIEELDTLFSVSRSISSNLELDHVFQELMNQVQQMMSADACSIMLAERTGLVLKASMGIDPESHPSWEGEEFDGSPRLQIWTAENTAFPTELLQQGFHTVLTVPMVARGNSIGLMSVFARAAREYSFSQVSLLDRVARQAAVAIDNSMLYEEKNQVTQLLQDALIPDAGLGIPGMDVAHRYIPSKTLSGDYYDLIPLGEKRFMVVMADVAGKGPEAAIQTIRAKNVIRSCSFAGFTPAGIMNLLNRIIHDGEGKLVTVFCAAVDLEARTLCYCNAGHEPPLRYRAEEKKWSMLDSNGVLVGATSPFEYEEATIAFAPGDSLILFTDGITEARCPKGEFFGTDPLFQMAELFGEFHPRVMVEQIYYEVERFTGGSLSDDLSLLAIRVAD